MMPALASTVKVYSCYCCLRLKPVNRLRQEIAVTKKTISMPSDLK